MISVKELNSTEQMEKTEMSVAIFAISHASPVREASSWSSMSLQQDCTALWFVLSFNNTSQGEKTLGEHICFYFILLMAAEYFTVRKYDIYFENVIFNLCVLKQYRKEDLPGWEVQLKNMK